MGYSTDFHGSFKLDKPLDKETLTLLQGLNQTRRMARKVDEKYGVEGEFYIGSLENSGQDFDNKNVISANKPPKTQPSLWCQWAPNKKGTRIEWDGGEKFYNYIEWIEYLINSVLKPRGYSLTGDVQWNGEDNEDQGIISITDNIVKIKRAKITFE